MSEVSGKKVVYQYFDHEVLSKQQFPGAREMGDMYGYINDFGYYAPYHDLKLSKKANPHLKTFKQWFEKNQFF